MNRFIKFAFLLLSKRILKTEINAVLKLFIHLPILRINTIQRGCIKQIYKRPFEIRFIFFLKRMKTSYLPAANFWFRPKVAKTIYDNKLLPRILSVLVRVVVKQYCRRYFMELIAFFFMQKTVPCFS